MTIVGFIITRKIINETTKQYWKEACRCIRLFYPDDPILIIDDNSDPQYVEEVTFTNCTLISNKDFPGSGELCAYYYFHKLRPFDKAVIIHDSIFFQKYIDFSGVQDVKFIWTFPSSYNHCVPFQNLLSGSKLTMIECRRFKCINSWKGCFGVMSVITWTFLNQLEQKSGLLSTIIPHITNRTKREYVERLYGLFCHIVKSSLIRDTSFLGHITEYCPWGLTFKDYQDGKMKDLPVVKVWTGR